MQEDKKQNSIISKFKWLVFVISGLLASLSGCVPAKRVPSAPIPEPTPAPEAVTPTPLPVVLPPIGPTCYMPMLILPTPTVTETAVPEPTATATAVLPPFPIISPVTRYCYAPPLYPPTPDGTPWLWPTVTPVTGAGIKGTNPVIAAELAGKGFLSANAFARIAGRQS
jgi:hypothetical protein